MSDRGPETYQTVQYMNHFESAVWVVADYNNFVN